MMNLWELLKVSKGLPPPDLETFLTAGKISGKSSASSTTTSIASGYPCVLENSAGQGIEFTATRSMKKVAASLFSQNYTILTVSDLRTPTVTGSVRRMWLGIAFLL